MILVILRRLAMLAHRRASSLPALIDYSNVDSIKHKFFSAENRNFFQNFPRLRTRDAARPRGARPSHERIRFS
jgi:hypothetical protein